MPKQTITYNLLISCPGDVAEEIQMIKDVVKAFNDQFTNFLGISIQVKYWRENAYPQSGGKPQDLLNKQIVNDCDAAVAVFWTRFGTPTEQYGSGTEEEIEIMIESGKQVFMYFSDRPQKPSEQDFEEYEKVCRFRKKYKNKGIYSIYSSCDEFKEMFNAHLTQYFLTEKRIAEDREQRKALLKLVGIDGFSYLNDVAVTSDFVPNVPYTVETIKNSIHDCFAKISSIQIGSSVPDEATENFSLMIQAIQGYERIKIDPDMQEAICAAATALEIEINENFFNLGTLSRKSLAPILDGDDGLKGTTDEIKKYRLIKQLYYTICQFLSWAPIEKAFAGKKCLKIALQNYGTAEDKNVTITLTFPKQSLLWIKNFPQFNNDEKEYLLNDCDMQKMFGIPESADYLEYEYPQKKPYSSSHLSSAVGLQYGDSPDYNEDYQDELEEVFCYSKHDKGDFCILKLKVEYIQHYTTVAFPTIIFINEMIESIDYEIISQNSPDVIKGTLNVREHLEEV